MTSVGPHTRGFLFADLRGYTRYTEQHGDAAAGELIGRYRALVRREIAAFHGAEIRTEGDSFYVVFGSVSQAVQAGLAIRDAARDAAPEPGAHPIRVGIGIHAGESTDGEHGIVSSAVNIAARVCAVAAPGEVLVTDTVRSLTRTFLTVSFKPRGRHRLKGISEPIALFQIEASHSVAPRAGMGRAIRPALIVGGLLLLVVVIASSLVRGPSGIGGPPLGTESPSPVASIPAETHDLSHFGDQGEFPNDAETALLDRLSSAMTSDCTRADRTLVPEFYFADSVPGGPTMELAVRVGVNCLAGLNRVIVWQASASPGGADELFFSLVLRRSLEEGSCESQSGVYESWSAGAHTGHVMCYINAEGSAVLEWSYAAANIYAIATRRDGGSRELYRWWLDVGRLLTR